MRTAGRDSRGFTLIEMMIAMIVFTTVILSTLGFYVTVAAARESSRNMTQAMADARAVVEQIRETSSSGLPAITGTDWTDWGQNNGLTILPGEAVTVTYADPDVDPLDVTVQIAWTERGRGRTAGIESLVTRR